MTSLHRLEKLAGESSGVGRAKLLRGLTDLFLEKMSTNTVAQAEIYTDIVNKVLDEVAAEARAEFASRISTVDEFPNGVVAKLAWDDFDVAAPVLEHSSALTCGNLVAVAEVQSDDHLLAISRRSEIEAAVTDVLIERGSDIVLQTVSENPGASFSLEGFGALAAKAKKNKKLQTRLVNRDDVTYELAEILEPVLSAQLKKRLANKIKDIDKDMPGLVDRAKTRVETALEGNKRDTKAAAQAIDRIAAGKSSFDAEVIAFAKKKRTVPLTTLLAEMADLPETMISGVLLKVNGTPLAIACKALRMSPEAFGHISTMRCKLLKLPESIGSRFAEQYASLNEADADRTIQFLKERHSTNADRKTEHAA